jgi:hypothetical protein
VAVGFATRLPSLTRFFLKSSAPAPPLVFENAFVFGIATKPRNKRQCLVLLLFDGITASYTNTIASNE